MTLNALLGMVQRAGIRLQVDGDCLRYDAPEGAMSDELRQAITRHKPSLLVALAPSRSLMSLRGGLTLPVEAVELAQDLEGAGVPLATDNDHQLLINLSDPRITDVQRAAVFRWRRHVAALVEYFAQEPVS